jgi:hypothetical protein
MGWKYEGGMINPIHNKSSNKTRVMKRSKFYRGCKFEEWNLKDYTHWLRYKSSNKTRVMKRSKFYRGCRFEEWNLKDYTQWLRWKTRLMQIQIMLLLGQSWASSLLLFCLSCIKFKRIWDIVTCSWCNQHVRMQMRYRGHCCFIHVKSHFLWNKWWWWFYEKWCKTIFR